jgi:hypothetical protein
MAAELIGASQDIFVKTPDLSASMPAVRTPGGWSRWLRPAFAIPVMAGLLLIVGYQNLLLIQSSVHRTPFELNAAFLLAWGPAVLSVGRYCHKNFDDHAACQCGHRSRSEILPAILS